jgi:transposase-like protein
MKNVQTRISKRILFIFFNIKSVYYTTEWMVLCKLHITRNIGHFVPSSHQKDFTDVHHFCAKAQK